MNNNNKAKALTEVFDAITTFAEEQKPLIDAGIWEEVENGDICHLYDIVRSIIALKYESFERQFPIEVDLHDRTKYRMVSHLVPWYPEKEDNLIEIIKGISASSHYAINDMCVNMEKRQNEQ